MLKRVGVVGSVALVASLLAVTSAAAAPASNVTVEVHGDGSVDIRGHVGRDDLSLDSQGGQLFISEDGMLTHTVALPMIGFVRVRTLTVRAVRIASTWVGPVSAGM